MHALITRFKLMGAPSRHAVASCIGLLDASGGHALDTWCGYCDVDSLDYRVIYHVCAVAEKRQS